MVVCLIKKISKGSRFNQIYLQKNEAGFEPGKNVVITPVTDIISKEPPLFEYSVKLDAFKKELVKRVFRIIDENSGYDNVLITGSFLGEGFDFEDVDIVIINPRNIDKNRLKNFIKQMIGIDAHLILMDSESFNKGIGRDPLFRLMIDRYVSIKRTIFRKEKKINYKLLDIYLLKNKNLIDGYDILDINQRKKLLRDFISIKLFVENKEITIENVKKETERIFGKNILERLFYYGDNEAKKKFLKNLKKEFNKLQEAIFKHVSKQG